MIAGEGEDEVVGEGDVAGGRGEGDSVFGDVSDRGGEIGADFAVLDAVVDVGQDPVFDVAMHLRAAVDEGDTGPVAPEVEGGDGSGVLAADDDNFEAEVGVGLVVVVADLAEVFAGDAEVVGQVVVAGGDDEFAGAVGDRAGQSGLCVWTAKSPSASGVTRSTVSYWRTSRA